MYGNWLVVEVFNWKIERNKSGKKETTNRGGLTALKMHRSIERKRRADAKYEAL